jgi:hypothetical protein
MYVDGGSLYLSGSAGQTQAFYSTYYLSVKNVTAAVNTPEGAVAGIVVFNGAGAAMDVENTSLSITGAVGSTFAGTIRDGRFNAAGLNLSSNDAGVIVRGVNARRDCLVAGGKTAAILEKKRVTA